MTGRLIPDWDIRDLILSTGGEDAFGCYQCGKCMAVCPWSQVEAVHFPVYQIPQAVKLGAILASEDPESIEREVDEVYRCVGCEACRTRCPHEVGQADIMRAIRRILVEYDSYPSELKDTVARIQSSGNPFGEPRENRARWADEMQVPDFSKDTEYAYAPCCVPAYDPRAKKVAQATVLILEHAGISFGLLGTRESCCGEGIRRAGAEEVFQETAGINLAAFADAAVENLLVTSPHCFTAFSSEYEELGPVPNILHITQLFSRLIKDGTLSPAKSLDKKVVYHDPCTLGRQSGIYDEPRFVLQSIPGIELVEIPHYNRQHSLCCGGGGGGAWLERPVEERLAIIRVRQALETGADILAVACPYCLQMFEDAVKTLDADIEVKDVAELLAFALSE